MTEKKNSEGLKFILKLDMAANDENKLLQLAREAIAESHDQRTFLQRSGQDLRVNPTSINLGAAIGTGHAMMNTNLSTNDKLNMVINKYLKLTIEKNPKISKEKALDKFCKDFAAAHPEQYGVKKENTQQSQGLNPLLLRNQARGY